MQEWLHRLRRRTRGGGARQGCWARLWGSKFRRAEDLVEELVFAGFLSCTLFDISSFRAPL